MNHFFEIIQIAVSSDKTSLNHILTDDEWYDVFDMAKKQAIAGVMFSGVEKLPMEQRPPKELLLQWYMLVAKIEERNATINRHAVRIVERFKIDGFRSCVLKGQGIASLYSFPNRRQSGDIDIWVEGGRTKVLEYVRKYSRITEVLYHHVDFNVLREVEIEVHFMPTWMYSFKRNRILQKWFRDEADKQFTHFIEITDCGRICTPTKDFNLVYLLLHIYRHLFDEGIGLRQLMDYYYLLVNSYDKGTNEPLFDKKSLLYTLKRLNLTRFAQSVMYVMQVVFGLPRNMMYTEPDNVSGTILIEEIMLAGNFGKFDIRNKVDANENVLKKFFRKQKRRFRFISSYTEESMWAPMFILWQRCWRWKNGYLPKKK